MKLPFLTLINPLACDLSGQDSAILEQLRPGVVCYTAVFSVVTQRSTRPGEKRGETAVYAG